MYLKINYSGQTKKVMVKDELRAEAGFFDLLERLTKLPRADIVASFKDEEDEVICISDQFDLDYFFTNPSKSNFIAVNVEPREGLQESANLHLSLAESQVTQDAGQEEPVHGFCCRPTAEMNIQTDQVSTIEQFCETQSCQQTHNGQQVHIPVAQECKDTQTKKPETRESQAMTQESDAPTPIEMKLLERIEALERSMAQSLNNSIVQLTPKQEEEAPALQKSSQSKSQVTTVHMGITCDGCKKRNFVGKRFKCLVCPDFDLCEACEANNDHQHLMVRCSAQGDTFILERLRRKYGKFKNSGFRFGGCGRPQLLVDGLKNLAEQKSMFPPFGSNPFCFANKMFCQKAPQPPCQTAPQPAQVPSDRMEKLEMLKFVLPDNKESWDGIMAKFGHLPLLEFCEAVTAQDEDN